MTLPDSFLIIKLSSLAIRPLLACSKSLLLPKGKVATSALFAAVVAGVGAVKPCSLALSSYGTCSEHDVNTETVSKLKQSLLR